MKLLTKINRGLIATVIILIAVTIYIVSVTAAQDASKPHIKQACQNYIALDIKYTLLPAKYLSSNKKVPQSEQDQIIKDMTKDVKAALLSILKV